MRDSGTRIQVWDGPIRIFHWVLVAAIAVAWFSAEQGSDGFTVHRWAGYTILTLLVFRLLWGLVGSETARFSDFVRGPRTVLNYLRNWHRGAHASTLGHNPLGALAILAMLALIAVQAVTGLFADDDVLLSGPFAGLVDGDTRSLLTTWHNVVFDGLLLLIALHIVVMGIYRVVRGENLVKPMITGYRVDETGAKPPWIAPLSRALLVLAISVALVAGGIAWFG